MFLLATRLIASPPTRSTTISQKRTKISRDSNLHFCTATIRCSRCQKSIPTVRKVHAIGSDLSPIHPVVRRNPVTGWKPARRFITYKSSTYGNIPTISASNTCHLLFCGRPVYSFCPLTILEMGVGMCRHAQLRGPWAGSARWAAGH